MNPPLLDIAGLDVAYGDHWPKVLPNLRYLGVGPLPAQIIRVNRVAARW